MRTEADLPTVADLPTEDSSTVTRVAVAEEESGADRMTVKQEAEAEAEDEEEQQMLCGSPVLPSGEASSGGEVHPNTAGQEPHETR
jgi:hypothetical protein